MNKEQQQNDVNDTDKVVHSVLANPNLKMTEIVNVYGQVTYVSIEKVNKKQGSKNSTSAPIPMITKKFKNDEKEELPKIKFNIGEGKKGKLSNVGGSGKEPSVHFSLRLKNEKGSTKTDIVKQNTYLIHQTLDADRTTMVTDMGTMLKETEKLKQKGKNYDVYVQCFEKTVSDNEFFKKIEKGNKQAKKKVLMEKIVLIFASNDLPQANKEVLQEGIYVYWISRPDESDNVDGVVDELLGELVGVGAKLIHSITMSLLKFAFQTIDAKIKSAFEL